MPGQHSCRVICPVLWRSHQFTRGLPVLRYLIGYTFMWTFEPQFNSYIRPKNETVVWHTLRICVWMTPLKCRPKDSYVSEWELTYNSWIRHKRRYDMPPSSRVEQVSYGVKYFPHIYQSSSWAGGNFNLKASNRRSVLLKPLVVGYKTRISFSHKTDLIGNFVLLYAVTIMP